VVVVVEKEVVEGRTGFGGWIAGVEIRG